MKHASRLTGVQRPGGRPPAGREVGASRVAKGGPPPFGERGEGVVPSLGRFWTTYRLDDEPLGSGIS